MHRLTELVRNMVPNMLSKNLTSAQLDAEAVKICSRSSLMKMKRLTANNLAKYVTVKKFDKN
jgi:hypothetical protein